MYVSRAERTVFGLVKSKHYTASTPTLPLPRPPHYAWNNLATPLLSSLRPLPLRHVHALFTTLAATYLATATSFNTAPTPSCNTIIFPFTTPTPSSPRPHLPYHGHTHHALACIHCVSPIPACHTRLLPTTPYLTFLSRPLLSANRGVVHLVATQPAAVC